MSTGPNAPLCTVGKILPGRDYNTPQTSGAFLAVNRGHYLDKK
jgi:hypothetical protein